MFTVNRSMSENDNVYEKYLNLTKQHWDAILDCKEKFLQNGNSNPHDYSQIDYEVAESWLRSKAYGVSPYSKGASEYLDSQELAKTLRENELLINVTKRVFEEVKLKDMVIASKYALHLLDANAVLLFIEGHKLPVTPELKLGAVMTEKNIGTCAHLLSMRLKRPVHLVGPEHYVVIFHNSCTAAAPVMDENGNVIATLTLNVHLENPQNPSLNEIFYSSHTLGLITAMAVAVENKLQSQKSYDQLKKAHFLQKVTMSVIDEGIVAVNHKGDIVQINKEAARVLKIDENKLENKHIKDYFSAKTISYVASGENIDIEETIIVGNDEQPYFINIRPVINETTGFLFGAVLRFNHMQKINTMVTSRSGAIATFTFDDIVGESDIIKKVIGLGKRFSRSSENILLTGESGTGKELFAQSIHNAHRPLGPFIVVNCAAMPRELIESELFGYEGGSFTGAERSGRPGKIELAHGGTLFLDEIGDMPLELQAVLLRVLEDKQVMRIGGRRYKKVDFRLISATNKDLQEMIKEKLFREDLYFRLSILNLRLPPLRERINDVEILAPYFIKKYCKKIKSNPPRISPKALDIFKSYNWPGNVRQLENVVIYAVNIAQNDVVESEDLPGLLLNETHPKFVGNTESIYKIETMEKVLIENALFKTKYNITKAAELLGLAKSTLYRKIKDYNISIDE